MSDAATSLNIRPAAVAGTFYPDDPDQLRRMLESYLQQAAQQQPADERVPKAIVAPHAGYIYSGPVAASAYARLRCARDTVERVVLIGPAHRVMFEGLATSSADAFATPLGKVFLDREAIDALLDLPDVHVIDEAHGQEHSLEVHLPFLQTVLDPNRFKLVPLVMGQTSSTQVAKVIERLWADDRTLIVISSDLSHYHDYDTASRIDRATSLAIESLRPQDIDVHQACGRPAIQALLSLAPQHHLQARTVDQRNSGDTSGPQDQVVGYGAYIFN